MLIYILYVIVFLFMLFIYKKDKNILIPILLLLVLNAFRGYSVGTDYAGYYNSYRSHLNTFFFDDLNINTFIINIGSNKANELGWGFLNYFGDKNNIAFYSINFFAISVILYFIYGTIRNQSPHFFFSLYLYLTLYLFFPSFNIIRQSIAIAIFAYSIRYINGNRPFIYLLFCLLASLFHSSALLLPLLYFLKYIKINSIYCIILLLFSFIIPIMQWDKYIIIFLFDTDKFLLYSQYANMKIHGNNEMGSIMIMFLFVIQTLIFIYCCLRLKGSNNIYMTLWFIGIFILNITMNYSWLFRISGYFLIAQIIAMPLVVYGNKMDVKQTKKSYFIIVGYSLVLYLCKLYIGSDGVVPYTTIFG